MTNLSINICDTSASLVLTSASYSDQSISSSYSLQSVSASWAPSIPSDISISSSWASSSLSSSFITASNVIGGMNYTWIFTDVSDYQWTVKFVNGILVSATSQYT